MPAELAKAKAMSSLGQDCTVITGISCIREVSDHASQVYSYFLGVYKVSVAVGMAGYALVILEIAGGGVFLRSAFTPLFPFMLLWYGLYFGVLGRDCAEVAADRMVSHADCIT